MYVKKRKHKKHNAKRKRVSGPSSAEGSGMNLLAAMAGVIGGAVASRFADNILAKQTTVTIDPKMLQMGKIAAGGAGAYFAKKIKQPALRSFARGLGMGFAAEAAVQELVTMKVLTGIGGGFGRVNPASLAFNQQRLNGPGKSQTIWPSVGQPVSAAAVGRAGMYSGVY
jgi:hypothetical protein